MESGSIINADTLHQEIKQERQLNKIDDTSGEIEVEIDVMIKSPSFIRPYHVKEEDKALIDKKMKHL